MNKTHSKILFILIFSIILVSCQNKNDKLNTFVNPFVGTDNTGNTNPSACVPFGMVQLGPDTRLESWEGSSGYLYKDKIILGFSHAHISGIGVPTWGDVLFMPMIGKAVFHSGNPDHSKKGYASPFSKETEKANPGYYSVILDNDSVKVE